MNHLQNVRDLEKLIELYHARNGTYCFHYNSFRLEGWEVWYNGHPLKREDYDRMEVDDFMVTIIWTDNSFSYDSYGVLLNDIIAWGEANGC